MQQNKNTDRTPIFSSNLRSRATILSAICLCVAVALIFQAQNTAAMSLVDQIDQSSGKSSVTLAVVENPELVTRVLESLLRSILYSASIDTQSSGATQKRGLDLGISRGFSGSQAGKHLMGLSAASFANGPGRR